MRKNISLLAIVGLALSGFSANGQDKIDFEKQIWPFVKESCVGCHGPSYKDERGRTRKPKAALIITNKEAFLKGGENNEEEPTLTPGDPKKTAFLQRTHLDPSSDEAMPPEGKAEPWTDEQKALFAKWVEQGADFGSWEKSELDDPEKYAAYKAK
ncbi:MAG: hypothetical protein HKN23_07790 [Verrucomicrobiales bacterium]|nr:hypothetical protein [Verrucomicrobiales bacterium]